LSVANPRKNLHHIPIVGQFGLRQLTMATTTNKTVLVTGGCGYIGSHTIVLLLEQKYNVVVVDNLINSSAISLDRVATIVGLTAEERAVRLVFHQVDICNEAELRKVFEQSPQFASAIHFAGLKVRTSSENHTSWFTLARLSHDQNGVVFLSTGGRRKHAHAHSVL
jgi:nucleoside-diphosphate-sugar epimerase